jgi:hypothetical protein
MPDSIDLLRLGLAFLCGLVLFPLAADWLGGRRRNCWDDPLAATQTLAWFLLYLLVVTTALGKAQAAHPGLLALGCSLWLLRCRRHGLIEEVKAWTAGRLLVALEAAEGKLSKHRMIEAPVGGNISRFRILEGSAPVATALLALAAVGVSASWYALENARFQSLQAYSYCFALHRFTAAEPVTGEFWLSLLAPLTLSGVELPTLVRFAGPVWLAYLAGLSGLAAWAISRRRWSFVWGALCSGGGLMMLFRNTPPEFSPAMVSTAFWLLGGMVLMRSRTAAVLCALAAVGTWGRIEVLLVCCLGGAAAGALFEYLTHRLPGQWRYPLAATGMALLLLYPRPALPDGPHLYESAARQTARIATEYPRNSWMMVAPTQQQPFLLRRGWHLELLHFVESFTPEQVAQPDFAFPYEALYLFVCVEKWPLRPTPAWQKTHPAPLDPVAYSYFSDQGRAGIQFQLAALMAAYVSSHGGVAVEYEDSTVVLYRIELPGTTPRPVTPSRTLPGREP